MAKLSLITRAVFFSVLTLVSAAPFALPAFAAPRGFAIAGSDKLSEFDYLLLGLSLKPEPVVQVVPRNTATGIQIALGFSNPTVDTAGLLALFPGNLQVAAELAGPGIAPTELRGPPGELLPIPPLVQRGLYSVRDIRLEIEVCAGEPRVCTWNLLLRGSPDVATVEVIDRILITQVTTRPLTAEEIRQKGILFGDDSFQGFNFTLAMQLESRPVTIDLPVLFDSNNVPIPIRTSSSLDISGPGLPTLTNTAVVPVMMGPDIGKMTPELISQLPPDLRIPGALVIPGDVGFLNQFFSAILLVSNGAPEGSGLTVRALTAKIELPPGEDGDIEDVRDNPLRLAATETETEPTFEKEVLGVGPDGIAGTGDDTDGFEAGEQGQSEFLLEGLLEGFHEISFDILGTLDGLPVGPIPIKGMARGGVLVRNPEFQLTFSAPATVRVGEEFSLFITVNNTSDSPANFVFVDIPPSELIGARLAEGEEPRKDITEIPPREGRVVHYRFVSNQTGQVTASYLKVDGADGDLLFHLGVDERGVPLSPDTIVLPASVNQLKAPDDKDSEVVRAALRVLGQAWSVATAPAGTLPEGVTPISRNTVLDRAAELAEAGFRVQIGESLERALPSLAMSWVGAPETGFEQLLRETEAGREFLASVGSTLSRIPSFPSDIGSFQESLAGWFTSLQPHILVGAGTSISDPPVIWQVVDGIGRALPANGVASSLLPNGAFLPLSEKEGSGLALLPRLGSTLYELRFTAIRTDTLDLTVTVPLPNGSVGLYVFESISVEEGFAGRIEVDLLRLGETLTVSLEEGGFFKGSFESAPKQEFASSGPELLAATVIGPQTLTGADPWGRVVALLFDRELRKAEASQPENYTVEANQVLSATPQLSGRLVFLFLRDPVGNFVPRQLQVSGLFDTTGKAMNPWTVARILTSLITTPGAIVTGRVTDAEGNPLSRAQILYLNGSPPIAISLKQVNPDGTYGFDYVAKGSFLIRATDPETRGIQELATRVRENGEHIVIDLVLLGRGGVRGLVEDLDGNPVPGARVLVKSQVDLASFVQTETDGEGRYEASGLVVGPVSVKAVFEASVGTASGTIGRAGTFATVDVAINLTEEGGKVSGTVFELDGGGAPHLLEGVEVFFAIPKGLGHIAVDSTLTNAEGAYSFSGMPSGTFQIAAIDQVRGRQEYSPISTLLAGQEHPPIHLAFFDSQNVGVIQGFVLDAGVGVPGAQVLGAGRLVETNEDGFYRIADVSPGSYPITAVHVATNRRASGFAQVGAGQVAVANLTLPGRGTVRVKVLDSQGTALTNHPVFRILGNPCAGIQVLTDQTGVAEFDEVPVGGAAFKAFSGGDVAKGTTAVQRNGDEVDLVIRFAGFGRVTGIVRDQENKEVFGADVVLKALRYESQFCEFIWDHRARQVRTGLDGTFAFDNVPVGEITATATHFAQETPATGKDVLLVDGDVSELELQFTSEEPGQLTGTIYLPDGETPAGEGVLVSTSSSWGGDLTVSTKEDGTYAFARILKSGGYTLTATDPVTGKKAQDRIVLSANQDVAADLRLLGHGSVEVEVRDGGDQLVEEALVEVRGSSFPHDEAAGALLPQDEGVITFRRLSEGRFTVTVTDNNGLGGRANGVITGDGDTIRVTVRLTVTGKVRGVYRTAPGGPEDPVGIPNGEVRLRQGLSGSLLGSTITSATPVSVEGCDFGPGDSIGVFAFDQVPAGTVLATATDPLTGRIGEASGKIEEQDQVLCLEVFQLGQGKISGRVVDGDNSGIAAAAVELSSSTGLSTLPNFKATATSDGEGRFAFDGVPVGSFTIKATFPKLLVSGTYTGSLESDDQEITDIEVVLEPSVTLAGTVFDADALTPIAGASLTLWPQKGRLSTVTDVEGKFEFQFVPVGSFRLTAEETGGGDAGILEGLLEPGVDVLDAELIFHGTGTISGQAFGSDGITPLSPLEEAKVTLTRQAPFARSQTTAVDLDGAFRFFDVPVGEYTLSLRASIAPFKGTTSGEIEFDGHLDEIVVQLAESRPVVGRVVRSDDAAAPNAQVILSGGGYNLSELTQSDGVFQIEGVPLGDFTLRVEDPITGGIAKTTVTISSTSPAEIDVGTLKLDDDPIEVLSVSPADGAENVSPELPIVVTFSDPVELSSFFGRFRVSADGQTLAGSTEFSTDRSIMTFTAPVVLPPNSLIEVFVSKDLKDELGRTLGEDFVATFTTSGAIVVGTVRSGEPVADAQVTLRADAMVLSTTTDALGAYRFDDLPFRKGSTEPVIIEVMDPTTLFRGRRSGNFASVGKITLDVVLSAVGTVSGTVYAHDQITTVAGAEVSINRLLSGLSSQTMTDENGFYAFDFVPLGSFTLSAEVPATGDRGQGTGEISGAGASPTVDIVLKGVGSVEVTVEDAEKIAVEGAAVNLSTPSPFAEFFNGTTDSNGIVTFERVIAGDFFVSATHPPTGLRGSKAGSVEPNETASITVELQPSGTIRGTVLEADETTPVEGAQVILYGAAFRNMVTESDGVFEFPDIPLGIYTLDARLDFQLRARIRNISLSENGQDEERDLVFVGTGTVVGTVLRDSNESPVQDAQVTLRSSNPDIGGFFDAVTDANGFYRIEDVPVGGFTATVDIPEEGLRGSTIGRIDEHVQEVNADVRLFSNSINLPIWSYDANNNLFQVWRDGAIAAATKNVFDGDLSTNRNAFLLDVVSEDVPLRYQGDTFGRVEEDGREILTQTETLAGLEVSRKVFVPRTGYFARFLETLSNPTLDPITVDVRISSHFREYSSGYVYPSVRATSSGDTTLDLSDEVDPDRWVVIDDNLDSDPFLQPPSNLPPVAFTFDGPGAPVRAGEASFIDAGNYRKLVYQWTSVTVPPGETITLLHFGAQQLNRAAAKASAERLVQLPPEALVGLSAEEIAQIRNFDVPTDGTSELEPLPALEGAITGFVLAGDGATPVASVNVAFKSESIFFGRTHTIGSASDGSFIFKSVLNDAKRLAVPVDDFTLRATDPVTGLEVESAGAFTGGFAGNLALGSPVNASSHLSSTYPPENVGDGNLFTYWKPLTSDSDRFIEVLLPSDVTTTDIGLRGQTGNYFRRGIFELFDTNDGLLDSFEITEDLPSPGNFDVDLAPDRSDVARVRFTGSLGLTNTPGVAEIVVLGSGSTVPNMTRKDVILPGLGVVDGKVKFASGDPAPDAQVQLLSSDFPTMTTQTDLDGNYVFEDVPAERVFRIKANHPTLTAFYTQVDNLSLLGHDDRLTKDVVLPAIASVKVTVLKADGVTPYASVYVSLRTAFGTSKSGTTDPDGAVVFDEIPEGEFMLNASRSGTWFDEEIGMVELGDHGQTVEVTIIEPPSGDIDGTVYATDGETVLPYTWVKVFNRANGSQLGSKLAYGDGFYEFIGIRPGRDGFRLEATSSGVTGEETGAFSFDGESVTVDVTVPVSVVKGTVYFSDGTTGVPNRNVFITQGTTYYAQTSGPDGHYSVTGVEVGEFTLTAQDQESGLFEVVSGRLDDVNLPVTLDVILPPSGTVIGTVVDADGNEVPLAAIGLASEGLTFVREVTADDLGDYRIEQVALGSFVVQPAVCVEVEGEEGTYIECTAAGSAVQGQLEIEDETVRVDLEIAATGTVDGTVLSSDELSTVPDTFVQVQNFDFIGPLGSYSKSEYTDSFGTYQAEDVLEGRVRVTAYDPIDYTVVGVGEGNLSPDGTETIDVILGTGVPFGVLLDGADGFRYDVSCAGGLSDGGTADRTLRDAYQNAYRLEISKTSFPCFASALMEEAEREAVLGPVRYLGLDVTRKIFVPGDGGFARYLEILTNPTGEDIEVNVLVEGTLGSYTDTEIVVGTAETDSTFAVTRDGSNRDPALAHVFGGPGALVGAAETHFLQGDDDIFYRWNLTVPAGETVVLMHFAVQRDTFDAAGAQTQAEALADLTELNALVGMSAAERVAVINFLVP